MKKILILLIVVTLALLVLIGGLLAQTKPDVTGTWVGYAIVGDGQPVDFQVQISKSGNAYTGKLSDMAGMIPETEMREIVLKDKLLTFEFDFSDGMNFVLIRIELTLDADTLKGRWFDPDGNSDIVDLARK